MMRWNEEIKTSVALATESSVYVWSRVCVVLVHMPLDILCPFFAASKDKRDCFMMVCAIVHSSIVL